MSSNPPSIERISHSLFPYFIFLEFINVFYQRIVCRGAGRSSQELVYPWTVVRPQFSMAQPPISRSRKTRTDQTRIGETLTPTSVFNTHYLIKVPKGLAPDPTRRTTSAEPGSYQPHLLMGQERHHQLAGQPQWGAIRERSVGLFLVEGCRELQCPLRRFYTPVHSQLHSRHSRCDAIHTFFPIHGNKSVYSVPLSQFGIKLVYRAPFRQLGRCPFTERPTFFHRFIVTLQPLWSKDQLLSLPTRSFLAKPREGLRQSPSPRGGNKKC